MDIRNYFSAAGGSKNTGAKTEKPREKIKDVPSGNGKKSTEITKHATGAQINKKQSKSKSSSHSKSKKSLDEDDDDVEIIADSDEDPIRKKVNGRAHPPSSAKSKLTPTVAKTEKKEVVDKKLGDDVRKKDKGDGKSEQQKNGGNRADTSVIVDSDSDDPVTRTHGGQRGKKRRVLLSESDESPVKKTAGAQSGHGAQEDSDLEEGGSRKKGRKKTPGSSRKRSQDTEEEPGPKTKGQKSLDSDSDSEDPLPKKKTPKGKKGGVVYLDDSDEDKAPKKGSLDSFVTHDAPKPARDSGPAKKKEEKKKEVAAADFFGGGAVHRTERNVPPAKRKVAETVDLELHDDDDFTKTLNQLDERQSKKPRRDGTPSKKSTASQEGGGSLASKLSSKMKVDSPTASSRDTNSNVIMDTPDSKQVTSKVSSPKSSPRKGVSKRPTPGKGVSKMEVTKTPEKKLPSSAEKKTPPKPKLQKEESGKGSAGRNWGAYRSFLNREGPRALGSKEIPTGAENCLEGLTFVISGVLESMERDEAKSLIERYGGKVTTNISNRTSYLVLGRDPGASKITKAEQCKTKQLDEDGLLDLIRTMPGKKSKYQEQAEQSVKKEASLQKSTSGSSKFTALKAAESRSHDDIATTSNGGPSENVDSGESGGKGGGSGSGGAGDDVLMWVDKHKPGSLKQIIGQQGDKSNAKKLLLWIQRWHKNRAAGAKPTGRFYGQDDGSGHRAALLSGPPGIGKTTTATLVCKEAGFSVVELNASDKRSKRSLKEDVAEALHNQTLIDFMGGGAGGSTKGEKHCVIMDEVDGMAGNEDRGGLQELVQLIKSTAIPVICICNDRNSIKMRTLANYCFDLRFQRPRLEQIKAALMSIAFREGLKISPPALQEIILSSNQDIRQCIHNLSMWTANHKELTYDQAKQDAKLAQKDLRLGIFDVSRKVFAGGEETAKMTLNDKSDLFFQDYSFVPLFVHENYVSVSPFAARGDRKKHLSLLARAADSISEGDLVDRRVRGGGNWNLLPTQAMHASVLPGEYMRGAVSQMIQFPAWLGKNSTTNKNDRILQELRSHMALQVSCDKRGLNMDYLPALRQRLTEPMASEGSEGVPKVIQLMDDYDITKDDYDNVLDISKWPNSKDPLAHLESKTKAAFTRQYNKGGHMTPYATGAATKKKRGRGAATTEEDYGMEEEEGAAVASESEGEEEGVDTDTMIKSGKKGGKAAAGSSKGKTAGKGKGKGKSSR